MALALMVTVLAILVVVLATQLRTDVGFAGASLVSLMSFGAILANVIKEWTLLELGMGAVSRLESFCQTVKSEFGGDETEELPEDWPRFGAIRLQNVSASYGSASVSSIYRSQLSDTATGDLTRTSTPTALTSEMSALHFEILASTLKQGSVLR